MPSHGRKVLTALSIDVGAAKLYNKVRRDQSTRKGEKTVNELHYPTALKAGQKEYRRRVQRGEHPYLPALDDILGEEQVLNTVYLGPMQVPAEYVAGTKTAGRASSFAPNFMPLLQPKTEFARKWETLCEAQLTEGIRDSVKAYEYMNRYYVQEGNKRVSVLKFFDAATIPADVTRILPPRDESPESRLYYEYLDFNKLSGVNYIDCQRLGNYKKLQQRLGKKAHEPWTEEERLAFRRFYSAFRLNFDTLGGGKLEISPADAMVVYLNIYSYQKAKGFSYAELRKSLTRIWDEIVLLKEENPIDLVLNPGVGHRKLLGKLTESITTPKVMKVAFIHDKNSQDSSWTYLHELGRADVELAMGDRIQTVSYFNALDGDPEEKLRETIREGAQVIFTTTPRLLKASLAVAVEHPDVTIMNCSLNTSQHAIRTYYARMYEAKFVIGAIAAALSRDGRLGYICDYPIYGVIAGINAFALGAQMVNPAAEVHLEWMNDGYTAALNRLQEKGITIISGRDMNKPSTSNPGAFGLFRMEGESRQLLAAPVWHWGVYYESLLWSIINHTFHEVDEKKAKNYWWGMSAGVVEVVCSERLTGRVRKLADLVSSAIRTGEFHPFDGVLKSQQEVIHASEDDSATPEEIIHMDWLAENVVGDLPSYRQLSWEGKATVDVVGVEKIAQQAAEEEREETEKTGESACGS